MPYGHGYPCEKGTVAGQSTETEDSSDIRTESSGEEPGGANPATTPEELEEERPNTKGWNEMVAELC